MSQSDGIFRRLRWPVGAFATVFVVGVAGYLSLGFSWVDSLSNTVLVLTTVGFSAREPLSTADKIFTDVVAVLGVSVYLAILAAMAGALAEGHFGTASRRRRTIRRARGLRDHIVVCAYGRVGRTAARELRAQGASFVVLDRLPDLEQQMRADGVLGLIGDPTSEEMLSLAGIERARTLITAVDSDADNVYITLTARAINPDLTIVARASEPRTPDRLYRAGADRVVSPYVSSGRHMAMLAMRPRVVDYLEIEGNDGEMFRLEDIFVEESSPLAGRTLQQVCGAATPLVLWRTSGELITQPSPDLTVGEGDHLVLLGAKELSVAEGG